MLVRALHFLIGALFGAGGGYLLWMNRASLSAPLFPPGPEGLPWMAIAGIAAATTGIVFVATAVIPRPKRAAAKAAAAAAREAKIAAADAYYGDNNNHNRAADRDWRHGDLPPPSKPAPQPPPEPLLKPAPPPAAPPPAPETLPA